ncbi:MAG TPA: hypothetical protein VG734_04985, partial [Lacunisphaera sp.]|nr:hypothetical protein [Lacunisphaera sp.]
MKTSISHAVLLLVVLGRALCPATAQDKFDQLCANCHGDQATGGKGGSLLGELKHGDDHAA